MNLVRSLQKEGFDFSIVPVDENGLVNAEEVLRHVRNDTILISIMHANGEVGTYRTDSGYCKVVT